MLETIHRPTVDLGLTVRLPANTAGGRCAFCDRAWGGRRRFCDVCLPAHADDPAGYGRRYQLLYKACGWHPGKPGAWSRTSLDCVPMPPTALEELAGFIRWLSRLRFCVMCEASFVAVDSRQICCSKRCGKRRNKLVSPTRPETVAAYNERRRKGLPRGVCRTCNGPTDFYLCHGCRPSEPKYRNIRGVCRVCNGPAERFVCESCKKDVARFHKRKYRALKKGVGYSRYNREQIFERDGWVCQLCKQRVNRRLRYPDRRSASLDHIIPLSRGGVDAPENVQLAHLGCNLDKLVGTVPQGEQLRLIG